MNMYSTKAAIVLKDPSTKPQRAAMIVNKNVLTTRSQASDSILCSKPFGLSDERRYIWPACEKGRHKVRWLISSNTNDQYSQKWLAMKDWLNGEEGNPFIEHIFSRVGNLPCEQKCQNRSERLNLRILLVHFCLENPKRNADLFSYRFASLID